MHLSTYHGETPLITRGPDIEDARPGDLDTITYEVLTGEDYLGDIATLGFVKGQPVPEPAFHAVTLQSIRILRESDRLRLLSLTCTGIIADLALDPAANSSRTFDPTPGTETYTSKGISVTRRTYQPTITLTYYTTTEPQTAIIGQIIEVENPPACPAARVIYRPVVPDLANPGQYLSFGEFPMVSNVTGYENQWILENRVPESVYETDTTGLWKVTDTIILTSLILQDITLGE